MRTKLAGKNKRKKIIRPIKAVITSAYQLNEAEISDLRVKFPMMGAYEVENVVNPDIYAGLIINVGTKRIDLSLERGLQNLKQFIYENS
ncbi:MAG: F0F1 ATP synthase subunit delta [Patescibacteria group bacterium]